MPTISCADLGVTYPGGAKALEAMDLEIESGVFTVLLGSSGAGKSTLLRCINGLVQPTTGSVRIDGRPVQRGRELRALRRRTGMVFQMHHLIGRQHALSNVLMGRLGHHSGLRTLWPFPRREATLALHCLHRVDLMDRAWQRCDCLSGGQRQRVAIARALCQEPDILLADEPVASLDPATAERVLRLMYGICKEDGLTAVVSLHQVEFARRFADRIVGIAAGRVVFDGQVADLDESALQRIYGSHQTAESDATVPDDEDPSRSVHPPTSLTPEEMKL